MKVVNIGHDRLILTEYNGQRYAFHKGVPVEIAAKVYNEIILSGFVNAADIIPVQEELAPEEGKPGGVDFEDEETYTGPTPKQRKRGRPKRQ